MLNGHGDDIYKYGKNKIVTNFSSNIYNGYDWSELDKYLCSVIPSIHSYPEPDAYSLISLLSLHHNVDVDNICMTNGATEAIYLIAQAYRAKRAAIFIPTFSEYEDACIANDIALEYITSLEQVNDTIDLIWICNPNNPTGKVFDKTYLNSFILEHPDKTIIIDQSYSYFTAKDTLSVSEAIQYPNVIQLHSMTKKYAIPGLRLGYFTAAGQLLENIQKFCMPWSVNQIAIEAGKYLLQSHSVPQVTSYLEMAKKFRHRLSDIDALSVMDSDTHYFLCRLKMQTAAELKSYLIEQYGILIRNADNFRGLDEHYFRIAAQSESENNKLAHILNEWIL